MTPSGVVATSDQWGIADQSYRFGRVTYLLSTFLEQISVDRLWVKICQPNFKINGPAMWVKIPYQIWINFYIFLIFFCIPRSWLGICTVDPPFRMHDKWIMLPVCGPCSKQNLGSKIFSFFVFLSNVCQMFTNNRLQVVPVPSLGQTRASKWSGCRLRNSASRSIRRHK